MIRFYCPTCGDHQEVDIEPLERKGPNPDPWGDIVCKVCHFVIATVSADVEGEFCFAPRPTIIEELSSNRVVDLRWLIVDTLAGPWFSLGFHLDFKRPYLDIHFLWWIITIGNYYSVEVLPEYEAELIPDLR